MIYIYFDSHYLNKDGDHIRTVSLVKEFNNNIPLPRVGDKVNNKIVERVRFYSDTIIIPDMSVEIELQATMWKECEGGFATPENFDYQINKAKEKGWEDVEKLKKRKTVHIGEE